MSQMPDKIWLHKDTKYSTGDIVCGYQYDFVQGIEDEGGIENFVEYVPKDAFIEKACEWLEENLLNYWSQLNANNTNDFIKGFKQSIKGG